MLIFPIIHLQQSHELNLLLLTAPALMATLLVQLAAATLGFVLPVLYWWAVISSISSLALALLTLRVYLQQKHRSNRRNGDRN